MENWFLKQKVNSWIWPAVERIIIIHCVVLVEKKTQVILDDQKWYEIEDDLELKCEIV